MGYPLLAILLMGKELPYGIVNTQGRVAPLEPGLQINDGKNLNINGLSSINSQLFNIVMNRCQNVHMTRVNVLAACDSPNTDGIHVRQSSDVTILNSNIRNGDDCISIGPGTSNMWIESITCRPGHGISLQINDGKNLNINGLLSSINSQLFNIVMNRCQNVHMTRVNVLAACDSPNTDGIHVRQSSDVTILNSNIRNGDDCISIGPGTSNMWIESITCGPRHGISIGSLGMEAEEDGVHNVTVKSSTFTGTQN
ncbi:polygalacturonase-like [Cucurbita maxima]|uniref:Polygalacturonase-like n=1 Tax=Cucurbita maxima TaxID=3661 RepID=A0A6J1IIL8_CUCMA|nr:polygalacturonase-like [Cucurbita maxima]